MKISVQTGKSNGVQVTARYGEYPPSDMMLKDAGRQLEDGQSIVLRWSGGAKMATSNGLSNVELLSDSVEAGHIELNFYGPSLNRTIASRVLPALRINHDPMTAEPWELKWFHGQMSLLPWQASMYAWLHGKMWGGYCLMSDERLEKIMLESGGSRQALKPVVDSLRPMFDGKVVAAPAVASALLNFSRIVNPEDAEDLNSMNNVINAAERAFSIFDVNTVAWAFAMKGFDVLAKQMDDGRFSYAMGRASAVLRLNNLFPRSVEPHVVQLLGVANYASRWTGSHQTEMKWLGAAAAIVEGDAFLRDHARDGLNLSRAKGSFERAVDSARGQEFDDTFLPDVFNVYANMKLDAIRRREEAVG